MKKREGNLGIAMTKRVLSSLIAFIFVFTSFFVINVPTYAAELGPVCVQGKRDFQWPVPGVNNITSCYYNRDYSVHNSQGGHFALDIAAAEGTTVVAAYGGKVIESRLHSTWGNTILIEHPNYNGTGIKLYTRYSHMNSRNVNVGDSVSRGTQIGTVGQTGSADGAHLDFCVMKDTYVNPWRDYAIDPYANQLLEMPNGFYSAGASCCDRYVNEVKELYSKNSGPLSISNIQFSNINSDSYTISCSISGPVSEVKFPTWPSADDSGNPIWHQGTISGDTASCIIRQSEHGNKRTTYISHIYAYDMAGNSIAMAAPPINLDDIEAPEISDIKISSVTKDSYIVTCAVTDNVGVTSVKFPTWPSADDSGNPIWHEGIIEGNIASCTIRKSEHGNKKGTYVTHIYAYDSMGNSGSAAVEAVELGDVTKPTIEDVYIKDVSATGYTVHCIVKDEQELGYVRFPTWTSNKDESGNEQDDIVWGNPGEIAGKAWELNYRVNISEHNNEINCWYNTHIYCYDAEDNVTSVQVTPIFIENIPPVISDVQITDVSEKGYTVSCVVNDEHSGINRVQFPTWYENDNPHATNAEWQTSSVYSGKLEDGRYVYRVNTSDYENQIGKYNTHIYAWDECGNQSECYVTETSIKKEHKHEYMSEIKKEATCIEEGIMLYTCKDNDDSYEEIIPATGHKNTEIRNAKEATCETEGYTGDSYCKDCNTKLSTGSTIEKKVHEWDEGEVTTKATCTTKGVKTYTCTVCGETKTEEIEATGHKNTEIRNAKEATCEAEGYTGDSYCKDCNTKLSTGSTIEKKVHEWDEGEVTTKATCTTKGVKTYTCTICGETKTEEIEATGHKNTEIRNAKEATCEAEGYTGDSYCKDCNTKLSTGSTIEKKVHEWDEGEVTIKATCTTKGIKTYTCKNCSVTRQEELSKTAHEKRIVKFEKKATCKLEGYTGDVYCQECGKLLEEGNSIPKMNHTWDLGRITVQATTTSEGQKMFTCKNCGMIKKEKIAKIPSQTVFGKNINDKTSNGVYKILKNNSVEFIKPLSKKASVNIPAVIKINGKSYKVIRISVNAFKNVKQLKTVVIGKNITSIGKKAFYGCKNLKSIIIKTSKLQKKNVGAQAFTGTTKNIKVRVPAKQLKIYKKFLSEKGMSKKAIYKK